MTARLVSWASARGDVVVFDTNILVEGFRDERRGFARSLVSQVRPAHRRTVVTCLYEFLRRDDGSALKGEEFEDRQVWLEMQKIRVLPFVDDAHRPLEELARRRDASPKLADAHVAAACIGVGRPLLTRNVGDFAAIARLRLVDLP